MPVRRGSTTLFGADALTSSLTLTLSACSKSKSKPVPTTASATATASAAASAQTDSAPRELSRIALGDEHACALNVAEATYCWGSNAAGPPGRPPARRFSSSRKRCPTSDQLAAERRPRLPWTSRAKSC